MTLPPPLSARRRALGALLAVGAAASCVPARAAGLELRVLVADSTSTTRDIVAAIGRRFADVQSGTDLRALMQRRGPAVYVALGPAALETAIDVPLNGPLLSLFSSNESFTRLANVGGRSSSEQISAIYAEASPLNQMSLIRELFLRQVSVGVLLSGGTRHQEAELRSAARAAGIDLNLYVVEPGEDALRAMARLRSSAALLMVPDRALYTVDNLRSLLESSYRNGQAMVGFSTSLVAAGTLAAAYSTIDDTVAQLESVVTAMASGRRVEPLYPTYWRVAINDNVARSLNLAISAAARGLGRLPP